MSKSNYNTPTEQKQPIPPNEGGFFVANPCLDRGTLGNTVNYERTSDKDGKNCVKPLKQSLCEAIESTKNRLVETESWRVVGGNTNATAQGVNVEQVRDYLKEWHARRVRYDLQNRVVHLLKDVKKDKVKKLADGKLELCLDEDGNPVKVPLFDVCTCGKIHKNNVYSAKQIAESRQKRDEANKILTEKSDIALDFDYEHNFDGTMLMYNTSSHKVLQRDMHRCGKVWQCPVCTSAIAKTRQVAIEKAVNSPKWCTMMMLTFTTSHHVKDTLETVQKGQSERYENMMRNKAFTDKLKNLGYLAKVTTKEVTVTTANGWHPHYHVLVFLEECLSIEEQKSFEDYVKNEWIRICKGVDKKGKPFKNAYRYKVSTPSYEHGADVRFVVRKKGLSKEELAKTYEDIRKLTEYYKNAMAGGTNSDFYAVNAKYTSGTIKADPTYEMTHWHKKNPFKGVIDFDSVRGFSPFHLAVIATTDEVPEDRRYWAKRRFLEYVDNYFGVQQTVFSRGFAEALGIVAEELNLSDEEVANATEKSSVELFYIEQEFFKFIKSHRFGEPRLYELAERSVQLGSDDVQNYVCTMLGNYLQFLGSDSEKLGVAIEYMDYFANKVVNRNLREYVEKQHQVIAEVTNANQDIDWGNTRTLQSFLVKMEDTNGGGAFEIVEFKPTIRDKGRCLTLARDEKSFRFKRMCSITATKKERNRLIELKAKKLKKKQKQVERLHDARKEFTKTRYLVIQVLSKVKKDRAKPKPKDEGEGESRG